MKLTTSNLALQLSMSERQIRSRMTDCEPTGDGSYSLRDVINVFSQPEAASADDKALIGKRYRLSQDIDKLLSEYSTLRDQYTPTQVASVIKEELSKDGLPHDVLLFSIVSSMDQYKIQDMTKKQQSIVQAALDRVHTKLTIED